MKLKDSQTFLNLAASFAGECQARTRYEFIEYGARNEGFSALAETVDKIVYNEFNHARMFYTAMQQGHDETIKNVDISAGYPFKEKWDMTENFRLAAEDEKKEAEEVYPHFASVAREEGFDDIAVLFERVAEIEKSHERFFSAVYNALKEDKLYRSDKPTEWLCGACGYKAVGTEPWEECPVCKAAKGVVLIDVCRLIK